MLVRDGSRRITTMLAGSDARSTNRRLIHRRRALARTLPSPSHAPVEPGESEQSQPTTDGGTRSDPCDDSGRAGPFGARNHAPRHSRRRRVVPSVSASDEKNEKNERRCVGT